ncbi:MAG: hypothetical protein PHW00_01870 [Clostridia bacterium]|nr:hypothetical protein [Clostridia bacterium]
MTDALNAFASKNNLHVFGNKVYGTYGDYDVSLIVRGDTLICFFVTQVVEVNNFVTRMEKDSNQVGIVNYRVLPSLVCVYALNLNIRQVLDYVCGCLTESKSSTTQLCAFCGEILKEEDRVHFCVDNVVYVGHNKCYEEFCGYVKQQTDQLNSKRSKPLASVILPTILCILVMALLTTLIWIINEQSSTTLLLVCAYITGYIASAVYAWQGGRRCIGQYVSITISIVIMFIVAQIVVCAYTQASLLHISLWQGLVVFISKFGDMALLWPALSQTGLCILLSLVGMLLQDMPSMRRGVGKQILITKL